MTVFEIKDNKPITKLYSLVSFFTSIFSTHIRPFLLIKGRNRNAFNISNQDFSLHNAGSNSMEDKMIVFKSFWPGSFWPDSFQP